MCRLKPNFHKSSRKNRKEWERRKNKSFCSILPLLFWHNEKLCHIMW
jgi:hypothetical protein